MKLFRIAEEQFARDLTGEGARLYGGRWNPKGIPMILIEGWNFLINPLHPDFHSVTVIDTASFEYNFRLVGRK